MDCSLPGSSVHGIFQARVLEWGAISFSRGSSWPRDQTWVSHIIGRHFTIWATREGTFCICIISFYILLIRDVICCFCFSVWLTSLRMTVSRCIHVAAKALLHSFWCEPVLLNPRFYNRLPSQWDPMELILLWEYTFKTEHPFSIKLVLIVLQKRKS